MEYKAKDIKKIKGHIVTKDDKFYFQDDGTGYCYWHKIEAKDGGKATLGWPLGHTSYDYGFRESSFDKLAELLNKVTKKKG